ncbi:cryptococcal mannosyltransferase 1-domain-containing protein [Amylostereum chailletii]|nr:cryptococcal mannosyltransferase 1-domain-containing protein [Amylostereum chailletii]
MTSLSILHTRSFFVLCTFFISLLFLYPWRVQVISYFPATQLVSSSSDAMILAQMPVKLPSLSALAAPFQESAYAIAPRRKRPQCSWRPWHEDRYADLAQKNIFIAINLYNNEDVLPTFFQEFPLLIERLGRHRVYISIYENNSKDKTVELLEKFDEMLTALGIAHRIVALGRDATSYKEDGHRIDLLSAVRNAAMEPLYSGVAAQHVPGNAFDEVLWMNDVFHCRADIFEVLYQKRLQGANQVCAVDWGGWGDYVVYDRWVLRTMTGQVFYRFKDVVGWMWPAANAPKFNGHGILPPILPYDDSTADRLRFEAHLPLQVFSCWNGATVFDAAPFLPPYNVRFRMAQADMDHGKPKNVTELASECFLSSVDFWKEGYGKIMIVPRASVTYNLKDYNTHRKDQLLMTHEPSDELITWKLEPPERIAFQDYANWYTPEARMNFSFCLVFYLIFYVPCSGGENGTSNSAR